MRKKNIAVIPARGGSKGVPHKNIKMINGKPLIEYTIKAALESNLFDRVVVSTDDCEIAKVSKEAGAEIPFMRPKEISDDITSSDQVVLHALDYYKDLGFVFENVCKLQPTSPLRNSEDIIEAFELFETKQADFVVSVCECEHSPLWCGRVDESLSLDEFCREEVRVACRQKLDTYYRLNGAIYIANVESFVKEENFFGENGFAYIMSKERSVDIDSYLDFSIAETIMKERKM